MTTTSATAITTTRLSYPADAAVGSARSPGCRCRGPRGLLMLRNRFLFTAALSFLLLLWCSPAAAHDLPANTIMNAFVKIEPQQAHLVVRIPLDLLQSFSFPLKGDQYDVLASGPQTRQALRVLRDAFILSENEVRLTASESNGRLSSPSDRAFEDYVTALKVTSEPPDPSIGIA